MEKKFKLTEMDKLAVATKDSEYLNNKGAKLYDEDTYYQSVEYYRLAAALGDDQAISNLGYCYLYGRDIEPNTDLAIAYFTIAANMGNVDGNYKLGDIYASDKWGVKDKEKSVYYYKNAVSYLLGEDLQPGMNIEYEYSLLYYPSLCYAIARETFPGGELFTDLDLSYDFLLRAKEGYEKALKDGDEMYEESYEGVLKFLEKKEYDEIKEKYSCDCDCCDDDCGCGCCSEDCDCGDECHCGDDCNCGCHDGKECTCKND